MMNANIRHRPGLILRSHGHGASNPEMDLMILSVCRIEPFGCHESVSSFLRT